MRVVQQQHLLKHSSHGAALSPQVKKKKAEERVSREKQKRFEEQVYSSLYVLLQQ